MSSLNNEISSQENKTKFLEKEKETDKEKEKAKDNVEGNSAIQSSSVSKAHATVLVTSEAVASNTPIVQGCDFNNGRSIDFLLSAFKCSGFQATAIGDGVDRINEMITWRMSVEESKTSELEHLTQNEIDNARTTIFLGLTSNMISSGNRECIRYLCEHNMIDCIVTTAGAIEEDIMKCFNPHYVDSFEYEPKESRLKGQNRIGNLLVPNSHYCKFEDWFSPILKQMVHEQKTKNIIWTPSKMIRRFGREINNKESVWYWCYVNNIPVFCPAITDGAIGDIIYFLSYQDDSFILDIARDIRFMNDIALNAYKSGMIILGGGVIKHHICNANLMRNGADFSVFINTAHSWDGSDSGAKPDEAISWGKIKLNAKPIKIHGDATFIFPLIVAGTFAHPDFHDLAKKPKRTIHDDYLVDELK